MDTIQNIQNAIDYIEEQIGNKLQLKELLKKLVCQYQLFDVCF